MKIKIRKRKKRTRMRKMQAFNNLTSVSLKFLPKVYYISFLIINYIGRFERFDEELGRGAYKIVYKGVDNETGREIAWNVINLNRLPK